MQRQILFEMEMCETKRSLILWEVRKKKFKGGHMRNHLSVNAH